MLASSDIFSWLFEGQPTYSTLQEKGLRLYDLGVYQRARQFLQLPALVGDPQAQFALASIIERDRSEVLTRIKPFEDTVRQIQQTAIQNELSQRLIEQAYQHVNDIEATFKASYIPLYEAAAEQGNIDAMLRLGGNKWQTKVRLQLAEGVERNDGEALLNMYALTKDFDWLKKSATQGHAIALYVLAQRYTDDPQLLRSDDLKETVDAILARSAEAGYPPARNWYSNRRNIRSHFIIKQHSRITEAKTGSIDAVTRYGLALSGFYSDAQYNDTENGFEADYIRGFSMLWLVSQIKGRENDPYNVQDKVAHLAKELTPDQILQAKNIARIWADQYPIVSEFRLRACLV